MAKKATTKKTEETKVTEAVKAEVKAEAVVEEPVKKAPAKKTACKTSEPVIKCTIEFNDKNTAVRDIVDSIYAAEGGKDKIKTLDVYVQPENNVAYYVINGVEEGKSVNF